MIISQEKIGLLRNYFSKIDNVSMAFVFGSYAQGRAISESDLDIAVYFKPRDKDIEWEGNLFYDVEDKVWLDIEGIVKKDVDLVVLNRAPSTLAFQIFNTGMPIIIKDELVCLRFFSRVSDEAIDFTELAGDWWKIKQRSASLSEIDKKRLIQLADFLENEIADKSHFSGLSWQVYQNDSDKRRNVERWVENIVYCSIDIAKIVLASEKKSFPETYKEMLKGLSLLPGFEEQVALTLAGFAKLRNILAHEYLDIRFSQIEKFLKEFEQPYLKLFHFIKKILA